MKRGPETNDSIFIISGLWIYRPDDNNQRLQTAVFFMIFASLHIFIAYAFKSALITISTALMLASAISNEHHVQTAVAFPQGRTQLSLSLNGTQRTVCVRTRVCLRARNNQ